MDSPDSRVEGRLAGYGVAGRRGLTRCDAARIWCGGFLSRDRHADRARQPDRGTLANGFDLVADPCARYKKRGHANQTASAAPALGDRITGDSVVCHAGAKCESLAPQTCAAPEGSRRADGVRQPERRVHCRQAQGKVLRPAVRADKATFPRRGLSRSDRNPAKPCGAGRLPRRHESHADEEVDRLLASKQYGARYARHWLDVLRYAEVDGAMAPRPESTTPNDHYSK